MVKTLFKFCSFCLAPIMFMLTACDGSGDNSENPGTLTITSSVDSIAVDGTTSATVSLANSAGVTYDQQVMISSQDTDVLTVSLATCHLSTAHNTCTVVVTGVSIGRTTISAAAINYATVTSAAMNVAQYTTLNYSAASSGSSTELTGVRGVMDSIAHNRNDAPADVYISGIYQAPAASKVGLLYQGPLAGNGTWYTFNYPSSAGATVINTALYGPNNGPQTDTIQIVGNYTTQENGSGALGLLYQGTIADRANPGNWLTLTPATTMYATGDTVINTIAHSTMGGYIVGNYDTRMKAGRAFICDTASSPASWLEITNSGALSITAYGIWHNGGTRYTIAGGYSELNSNGADSGYLVDWDSSTQVFSHWQSYNYKNQPLTASISHFEGLTSDGTTGFYLPADWLSAGAIGASITHVVVNDDGSFGTATWTDASYPGAAITSANSTYLSNLIGVYAIADSPTSNGYVATFASQ